MPEVVTAPPLIAVIPDDVTCSEVKPPLAPAPMAPPKVTFPAPDEIDSAFAVLVVLLIVLEKIIAPPADPLLLLSVIPFVNVTGPVKVCAPAVVTLPVNTIPAAPVALKLVIGLDAPTTPPKLMDEVPAFTVSA